MKFKLTFIFCTVLLFAACDNKDKSDNKKIEVSQEKAMLVEYDSLRASTKFTQPIFTRLLEISEKFATEYPENPRSTELLFDGAMNAILMGEINAQNGKDGSSHFLKVVELFDRYINEYPNFEHLLSVYELKASMLDFDLERDGAAIKTYQFHIDN